jgi:transcriptional regulator with XRE-family HTH domain
MSEARSSIDIVTERGVSTMASEGSTSLADKLNYLFSTAHPKDRGPYTHQEVQAATTVSSSLLSALRSGKATNPTKETLQRLANFFGVEPAYFFDDQAAEETIAQLGLLAALRDNGVAQLAMRAAGLSAESLDSIRVTVERIRKLEGLDD